ncbi:DEAD/DEAH box helicase [soil metagenome]
MSVVTFSDLNLLEPIQRAVSSENYTIPTPIQAQAIPHLLEGRDLLGCAQTGTGKTAAFALPILHRLSERRRMPIPGTARCLVLTPTRELATQIGESFKVYGKNLKLTYTVIFGGVGQNQQVQAVARGVDIIVATPGRLMDLMQQGKVHLGRVEIFVLDEADRMLDMGFIADIREIQKSLPAQRQSLFFSATMPKEIVELANSLLRDPVSIVVAPVSSTAELVDQRLVFIDHGDKFDLLADLLEKGKMDRVLIFVNRKTAADRLARDLQKKHIEALALHGDKAQTVREKTLDRFRTGEARVLIATDVASRGIDIDNITHVINYEMPIEPEAYVHRIGRTARAGAFGVALSFCDADEMDFLKAIEKTIKKPIPVITDHPYHSDNASRGVNASGAKAKRAPRGGHGGGGGGGASRGSKPSGGGRPQGRSGGAPKRGRR